MFSLPIRGAFFCIKVGGKNYIWVCLWLGHHNHNKVINMAWNRDYLKKQLKRSEGLDPNKEDGLIDDELIHDAINTSMDIIADDCNLLPVTVNMALTSGQWEYSLPDDILSIRRIWYIDSNGTHDPLRYYPPEDFLDYVDPTDTTTEPTRYSYSFYDAKIMEFWINAPDIYDYGTRSHVTESTIRTLVDSGANFGKTLDGRRIKPKFVVYNVTDNSYGYVDILDITTNKTTGTATSGTTTTILEDTGKDFVALGVSVNDIICNPSSGAVTSYAFVKTVATTKLTYEDIQGSVVRFKSGDTYKVGKATEIKLSEATPHPGLRNGATNDFTISSSALATITATTFTNTRCTGTISGTATVGNIAIASGGSHGKITAVASTYVDVEYWIGGKPVAGQSVSVKACDEYQVQDRWMTEQVLWIDPATTGDSAGTESLRILYNRRPAYPESDTDTIEIPQKYERPLRACIRWQVAELAGKYAEAEVIAFETKYKVNVREFLGDVWRPPLSEPVNLWRNQQGRRTYPGRRDSSYNGYAWKTWI